jgi:hypothetical protein
MPFLMIDLENRADCQKGLQLLKQQLGRKNCDAPHKSPATLMNQPTSALSDIDHLPLPQKLKRIQSRGMWKHLVKIAQSAPQPSSLPELDDLLEMPKNKMRSLKAIMAKLENRFGIQFLKVDPDAGLDAAGNPRYVMLPNVRRQILRLAAE